jgi:hypothetical protein
MIEQLEINGRRATVAYVKSDWSPASRENHALAKVTFADGQVLFLVPAEHPKHVIADYDPDEPRNEQGEWTTGGGSSGGSSEKAGSERKAATPKAEAVKKTATATGTHSYPKERISGTKPTSHPAKISPSVTSTKFKTQNSDNTYVQNDLAQMQRTEDDPVKLPDGTTKGRFSANMDLMKNPDFYPGMRPEMLTGSANDIAHNAIRIMKTNMNYLLGKATAAQLTAVNWYRGARQIVDHKVKQYGLNDASVAAVYAALSPQKDWDQNIYLGDQLIDIYMTKQEHAWDDGMQAFADKLVSDEAKSAEKKLRETGKVKKTPPMVKMLPSIVGKTLAECESAEEKGLWIRAYEEAHGDPAQNGGHGFRIYNPDGTFGDFHTNAPDTGEEVGAKSKAGWNNTKATGAAVAALMANGDRIQISEALSQVHKVRNFYNNILDPDGLDGDVTMDTHAIGAAWMQPYPGGAPAVSQGLANNPSVKPEGWEPAKDSNRYGAFGTYGIYAEAYRQLAAEQKPPLLPNQMQAVIWVVKRDLFANLNKADDAEIAALWKDYNADKITHDKVLDAVWAIGERANARKS